VSSGQPPARARQHQLLQDLMAGHQRFLSGDPLPKRYSLLGSLQQVGKDVATVLSCSDSRVAPELVFDQSFGDLFVVRSAGHCLDEAILGSLEFAVTQVNSPLLIVMGHEDCRAVNAALNKQVFETPNLNEVIQLLIADLGTSTYGDLNAAVKAHIHNTAGAIAEKSPILGKKIVSGELMLAKLFISVSSGEIEVLD
jgi:carbonic anhydrase